MRAGDAVATDDPGIGDYREALLGEIARLERLLVGAPHQMGRATPCPEWSVLDVARHVTVTPRLVGEAFDASLPARKTTTPRPLPADAGLPAVLDALRAGAGYLRRSLSGDRDLRAPVPARMGPLPAGIALRLTLAELTVHRCDVEIGLGHTPAISDGYAGIVVTTTRDWLLRLAAPGSRPPAPTSYVLTDGDGRFWTLCYDGENWTGQDGRTAPTITPATTVRGPAGQLALALAGRIGLDHATLSTTGPGAARLLKTYLPGP